MFIGATIVVCLLTLAIVLFPRRTERAASPSATALYLNRVAELDAELARGDLTQAEHSDLKDELGASVLPDIEREQQTAAQNPQPVSGVPTAWLVLIALALPVGGAATYLATGEPDADWLAESASVLQLDPGTDRSTIRKFEEALERRTRAVPDDHESWYLLAHARLKLDEFARSAAAFASVNALTGPDPRVDVYWLQTRFLAADGVIDETSQAIAQRLLAQSPNDAVVLEVLALAAFRDGEFAQSARYLQRALAGDLLPSRRAALNAGLAETRARMGDVAPRIDVEVSLAETPPAGSSLFVLARRPGERMPLAVVRVPAEPGTTSVRLDDAALMNPAAPLSSAGAVEVVVRVSRSGMAASSEDDWRWQSEPIPIDSETARELAVTLSPPSV